MNDIRTQELYGKDRGEGRECWKGNNNTGRDCKTGRYISMGSAQDIKIYRRKYYEQNKEKITSKQREYYAQNCEKLRSRVKEWRVKNKEYVRARAARYRRENLEKLKAKHAAYYEANKQSFNVKATIYTRSHPEQRMETQHRYNTSVKGRKKIREWLGTTGKLPKHKAVRVAADARRRALEISTELPDARVAMLKLSTAKNQKCFYCGKRIPKGKLHCDHVKPLSRGGVHAAFNLVPSCQHCNQSKGKKQPNEFVKSQQLLVF